MNYILLKDLPDAISGTLFSEDEYNEGKQFSYFTNNAKKRYVEWSYVENNPEWFKPEFQPEKENVFSIVEGIVINLNKLKEIFNTIK